MIKPTRDNLTKLAVRTSSAWDKPVKQGPNDHLNVLGSLLVQSSPLGGLDIVGALIP